MRADEKLRAFLELEGVTRDDDLSKSRQHGWQKESGHTPTLRCLAYKAKWPPKKDGHSSVWGNFLKLLSFQEPPLWMTQSCSITPVIQGDEGFANVGPLILFGSGENVIAIETVSRREETTDSIRDASGIISLSDDA